MAARAAAPQPRKSFKAEEVAQFALRHAARAAAPAATAEQALDVFRRRAKAGAAAEPQQYALRDYISWYDASAAVRGGYPYLVPCARAHDGAVVPLDKRARDAAFEPHVPPSTAAAIDLAARPGTRTGLPVDPAGVPLADARYAADCAAAGGGVAPAEAPADEAGLGKGGFGKRKRGAAAVAEALLSAAAAGGGGGAPSEQAPELRYVYRVYDADGSVRGVPFEWLPTAAPQSDSHAGGAADWHSTNLPEQLFYPLPPMPPAGPSAAAAAEAVAAILPAIAKGAFMMAGAE